MLRTVGLLAVVIGALAGARHQRGESKDHVQGPTRVQQGEREIAMIYIGAEGCAWSTKEGLAEAVEKARIAISKRVGQVGVRFVTVGIARDWSVEAGVSHLRRVGRFDELLVGRNWTNLGVQRYIWEDIPGDAATPQVLIVDRRMRSPGPKTAAHVIDSEVLLVRKVGYYEILRWVEQGANVVVDSVVERPPE